MGQQVWLGVVAIVDISLTYKMQVRLLEDMMNKANNASLRCGVLLSACAEINSLMCSLAACNAQGGQQEGATAGQKLASYGWKCTQVNKNILVCIVHTLQLLSSDGMASEGSCC